MESIDYGETSFSHEKDEAMSLLLQCAYDRAKVARDTEEALSVHRWQVTLTTNRSYLWTLFHDSCPLSLARPIATSVRYIYKNCITELTPDTLCGMAVWEYMRRRIKSCHGSRFGSMKRPVLLPGVYYGTWFGGCAQPVHYDTGEHVTEIHKETILFEIRR